MAYTKQIWASGESGGTPISADRLNYMEQGIQDAHISAEEALIPANQGVEDYIVAQGTSDVWTWRKWSNGVAECFGAFDVPDSNNYVAQNSYIFPFVFTSIISSVATLNDTNYNSSAYLTANVKIVCGFDHCTISAHSSSAVFNSSMPAPTSVYVIGKWE